MTTVPGVVAAPTVVPAPVVAPVLAVTAADAVRLAIRRSLAVLLVAVLLPRSLPFLGADASLYRPAWVEWGALGLLGVVAGAVVVSAARGTTLGRSRGPLLVTVFVASAMATAAVPPEYRFTSAHWSWFIAGWFVVSVLFGERTLLIVALLALHLGLVFTQVALGGPLTRAAVAQFAIRTIFFTGGQIAFAAAGGVTRRFGAASARVDAARHRSLTERRIAEELMADDRARHAALATTAVPLLEGLSSGRLDPEDPAVRRRCLIEATRLRRRMAEADRSPDALEHELQACVDLAERAGVQVDVSYRGTGPAPGLETRRRLTEPVIAALAEARERARVTVVESPADVVVSVVADTAVEEETVEGEPGVQEEDVTVEIVRASGRIWVTARWSAS